MRSSVIILGSTGSIGINALEICRRYDIEVEALSAGTNLELLQKQIDEFKPRAVAIGDGNRISEIEHEKIFCGSDGILELIEYCESGMVLNSLVGFAGLRPTIKSLECGKTLALANKESLVVAGAFIEKKTILPIDSEHFGLWYLINDKAVDKLYITASGGAFRDWDIEKIKTAGYGDALKHPNWSMGDKITIDSATMMNKLFELLEARWLFDTDKIDACIEKKSLVHALVEFKDGSTTAHIAKADMKLPIAYALLGNLSEHLLSPIDLLEMGPIGFEPISEKRYPLWSLKNHLLKNPRLGVVLNAANETGIEKFKSGEYNYFETCEMIISIYDRFQNYIPSNLDDVFEIDKEVRRYAFDRF